jgi:hypothetical protein
MNEEIGFGALPDLPDSRDYIAEIPMGAVSVDWDVEYRLPEPPTFDQRSSDSCVACAWSYYHWQLTGKTFSKRDLFCRIFQQYGAYIRDGGLKLIKEGQADNKEVKDPSRPTMQNMRDSSGTKEEFRVDDIQSNSFKLQDQTIDGVAWGIKEYKGVVFGVVGSNEGWQDKLNPRPPMLGEKTWGHALYAFGYHKHDGVKCIIAKSSWSATNEHHIKENYFQALDATFSAWTLIPKEQQMDNEFVQTINNKGKVGVVIYADTVDNYKFLCKTYLLEPKIKPDGSIETDLTV